MFYGGDNFLTSLISLKIFELMLEHGWVLWEEMEDAPYELLCLPSYGPKTLMSG